MPPSNSENDLKRLARRRLIGAVALTLLAVIMLPLLLEDEPPPASTLAVRMAAAPQSEPTFKPITQPEQSDAPAAMVFPTPPVSPPSHAVQQAAPVETLPNPEPVKAETVKPEPAQAKPAKPEPVKTEPVKAIPKSLPPPAATATSPASPVAAGEVYVVQLAALSDPDKAQALKARVVKIGLPAYTDKIGALTRVRVGPYGSRTAAVAAAVKLAENGMKGQVLSK